MKAYKTSEGFLMKTYSNEERNKCLNTVGSEIQFIGIAFTTGNGLKYKFLSEKEVAFEKYEAEIEANGKHKVIRYNILNSHSVITKAVNKMYEK